MTGPVVAGSAGVVGTEALAELARRGDTAALDTLVKRLMDKPDEARRIAARAVARDLGRPHLVRRLLVDDVAPVRLAAAGAVLASRNWSAGG